MLLRLVVRINLVRLALLWNLAMPVLAQPSTTWVHRDIFSRNAWTGRSRARSVPVVSPAFLPKSGGIKVRLRSEAGLDRSRRDHFQRGPDRFLQGVERKPLN